MRLVLALALALAGCRRPPAAQPDRAGMAELKQIDDDLDRVGRRGTSAGALLERRGELLERMGRLPEAMAAYDEAAVAYDQSPEGTAMPPVRAARARERADRLRGQSPAR